MRDITENNYKNYDYEMKMSVCRAAFELHPDIPPHIGMFELALEVGYVIPDKWEHLHSNKSLK